jgi:hypothetical protein
MGSGADYPKGHNQLSSERQHLDQFAPNAAIPSDIVQFQKRATPKLKTDNRPTLSANPVSATR